VAVVSAPDARKGERLVLVTAKTNALRSEVQAHLKARGANELMIPAEILIVPALPVLATGKTDFVALNALVRERVIDGAV
jgi:acyl-[acyl-carrier-protein]-phospholipid O-acyltransferase/long-chain-fatty-acid--[acyl-carrier-protein] ligase